MTQLLPASRSLPPFLWLGLDRDLRQRPLANHETTVEVRLCPIGNAPLSLSGDWTAMEHLWSARAECLLQRGDHVAEMFMLLLPLS